MTRTAVFDDTGATATWTVRERCLWSRTFTATSDDVPVNLTSYTITAEITADESNDTALRTFTVTKTNAAAGEFRISIAAANATLTPGRYYWSLQWDGGSGAQPLASGPFTVKDWTL